MNNKTHFQTPKTHLKPSLVSNFTERRMAISRILLARPPLHFHNRSDTHCPISFISSSHEQGISASIRWCSSSSPSKGDNDKLMHVKGKNATEDPKAVADESYMEKHPMLFQITTETCYKDTGSWFGVKSMFTNLKEKMLRKFQFQRQSSSETAETSHPTVDSALSDITMTHTQARIAESRESKGLLPSSEAAEESGGRETSASWCMKPNVMGENSPGSTVDTTASEIMKVNRWPNYSKVNEPVRVVQGAEAIKDFCYDEAEDAAKSSEVMGVSLIDEKNASMSAATCVAGGHSYEEVVELEEISDEEDLAVAKALKDLLYGEGGDTDKSSEVMGVSLSNKGNVSLGAESFVARGNSIEEMVESEEISDDDRVELAHEHMLEESLFGSPTEPDGNKKPESKHLFSFTQVLLGDAFAAQKKKIANGLTSSGNEKSELEQDAVPCAPAMNSGSESEVDEISSPFNISDGSEADELPLRFHITRDSEVDEIPSFDISDGSEVDEVPSSFVVNGGSEVDEKAVFVDSCPDVEGLVNDVEEMMNNQTVSQVAGNSSDLLTPGETFESSDGTSQENVPITIETDTLMSCIRGLPESHNKSVYATISSASNDHKVSIGITQPKNHLQSSGTKRKHSLKDNYVGKKINWIKDDPSEGIPSNTDKTVAKIDEKCSFGVAANICVESKPKHPKVPLPSGKTDKTQTPISCPTRECTKNNILVRFLSKDLTNSEIIDPLSSCGCVLKIQEVSSFRESIFKDVLVYFETSKGLQEALKRAELRFKKSCSFVEATTPRDVAFVSPIPELIGDPEIPVGLVKNPTNTIKIKQLTREITSQQLKEALSFCESGITSFFLGTSSSTAYVEFEREDAKEKALAKYSIDVLGKQLLIFRVDAPRTTVIRLHNIGPNRVSSICKPYGKVNSIKHRQDGIVDVFFCTTEWPNMLDILNSLNGLEIDGGRCIAQSAPVFPPPILQALWRHPEERRRLTAKMQSLLSKVEHTMHTDGLTEIAAKYYDHGF